MKNFQLTLKAVFVACLILVMLIPAHLITNLITERAEREQEVVQDISSKWAGKQTIAGPVLEIPYKTHNRSSPMGVLYFLPDEMKLGGTVTPEVRHRSVFDVAVYRADMTANGHFNKLNWEELGIKEEDIMFSAAKLSLSLSDYKGIEDALYINWQGKKLMLNADPYSPYDAHSLSAKVDVSDLEYPVSFSLPLKIKGTQQISFTPLAKNTQINLQSSWSSPSFNGAFLPSATSEITADGFSTEWKVNHINTGFPAAWKDKPINTEEYAMGVSFISTVNTYSQVLRSAKYAILVIALTFGAFFLIEVLQHKKVHHLQYTLVGLALVIFYSLLLSISEYTGFKAAYLIASFSTVTLVTLYTRSLFKEWKNALLLAGLITTLYTFIYLLLQLTDGALLLGTIGLFILLAIIMYVTRNINWYQLQQPAYSANKNLD